MRNTRLIEILTAAADAMEAGMDPFDTAFLADNRVSLDECFTMAELIAVGARLVAFGLEHPAVARGALNGAHLASAYGALNDALMKWTPLVDQGQPEQRAPADIVGDRVELVLVHEAEARGYARAVARLRDDERYRSWWTASDCADPDGVAYWKTGPRNHLADYLETIGPDDGGGDGHA